ncbi:MAG: hypothetical protein ACR2QC_05995 [Gammaproteobacteria bacterium]
MTPDTIYIIATVILAAVGIIAVRRTEITDVRAALGEIHADMRDVRADMREIRAATAANTAAIGKLEGALLAHIGGHTHDTAAETKG